MSKENLQIEDMYNPDDPFGLKSFWGISRNTSEKPEPLVRRVGNNVSANNSKDKRRPQMTASYLIPFHGFADRQSELTVLLPVQSPETDLKQSWRILFLRDDDGSLESYVAEMLVFKRKLYEQTNAGKAGEMLNIVKLASGKDFALFEKGFSDEQRCVALLRKTLMTNVHKQLLKIGEKQKTISFSAFSRCDRISSSRGTDEATGKVSTKMSIYLTGYWLDWFEAAAAVGFDFKYLAQLDPLSMRCYELVKLLCYDRNVLPPRSAADGKNYPPSREVATLKINYEFFAKLMPIPVLKDTDAIKTQIETLCRINLEKGFLEDIQFEKDEIIFTLGEFSTKNRAANGKNIIKPKKPNERRKNKYLIPPQYLPEKLKIIRRHHKMTQEQIMAVVNPLDKPENHGKISQFEKGDFRPNSRKVSTRNFLPNAPKRLNNELMRIKS